MKRLPLDVYDAMPSGMRTYISNYGWHFNRKAVEYASQYMYVRDGSKSKKLVPYTKEHVDNLLKMSGIELENDILYDSVYVANMCKADFLGSSIKDERSLALFVKDTIDDVDAPEGCTFRRWLATMVGAGIPVEWDDLL